MYARERLSRTGALLSRVHYARHVQTIRVHRDRGPFFRALIAFRAAAAAADAVSVFTGSSPYVHDGLAKE